jgi:hypothetical protein
MSYFHAQTAHRKRIDKIASLRRHDVTLCANEEEDRSSVVLSRVVLVIGVF